MDLSFAEERLTEEFIETFSAAVVTECLEGSVRALIIDARITSYIPMLAERIARDHLRATRKQQAA